MTKFIRGSIQIHKWLGVIMFPVFLIWCLSGFVMLFHSFPYYDSEQLFYKQTNLNSFTHNIETIQDTTLSPSSLSLQVLNNQAIYLYKGKNYTASNFSLIEKYTKENLDQQVEELYQDTILKVEVMEDLDIWIPWKHLTTAFPIYKYYIDDDSKTQVYFSQKTGRIVQETTQKSRFFAYIGAIPHLFYYKWLKLKPDLYRQLIIILAIIGMIVCLSGIIMGFYMSLKSWRRSYKISNYRKWSYRWHHILGLFFGLLLFTFLFSGMLYTIQIPQWIISQKRELNFHQIWNGKELKTKDYVLPISKILSDPRFTKIKKIEWKQIDEKPYYFLYKMFQEPIIIDAETNDSGRVKIFTPQEIESIFAKRFRDTIAYTTSFISETDGYYNINKPLSVLRFELNDADNTWIYIDSNNPGFLPSLNKSQRIRRWLYHGLHTFDIPYLFKHQILRKSILIVVLLFLSIISITGSILGIKYIKRKKKRRKKAKFVASGNKHT